MSPSPQPNLQLVHAVYNTVLTFAKAGVPPFMVGPAGCGKTTIAKQVAMELGLEFYYTGAVESAFQLRGFRDAHGNTMHTPFRDASDKGGVFLFDELDASDPQAIVSVHAALDNGVLDAPDGMVKRHENFRYLAAGNTWGHGATLEYMGRNALDGASLDRYGTVAMDYDPALEANLAKQERERNPNAPDPDNWLAIVHQARKAVRELKLRHVVSTRAIVYGLKLRAAGMEVKDVFDAVVAKGLPEDDAEKVVKKINMTLTQFEEALKPARRAAIMSTVAELEEKIVSIQTAETDLTDAAKKAADVSKQALDLTGKVGTSLAKASTAVSQLQTTQAMLDGIGAGATPVVTAAEQALEGIRNAAGGAAVAQP